MSEGDGGRGKGKSVQPSEFDETCVLWWCPGCYVTSCIKWFLVEQLCNTSSVGPQGGRRKRRGHVWHRFVLINVPWQSHTLALWFVNTPISECKDVWLRWMTTWSINTLLIKYFCLIPLRVKHFSQSRSINLRLKLCIENSTLGATIFSILPHFVKSLKLMRCEY